MDILRVAILSMLRQKRGKEFSPLDVIQMMYPEDWKHFQEEIYEAANELYQEGLIEIWSGNCQVPANKNLPEDSKIRKPAKLI